MSQKIASLYAEIGANTAGFEAGAKKVSGGLKSLGSAFSGVLPAGAAQFLTLTGAITGTVSAFKFAIDQAAEAETVQAKLNAVLESTGGAAGLSADELDKMATSLSHLSTFDDEAIKGSEALLLTFTNIGKDVFPQVQQAILDVSTALGQDLQSSTIQLGKALNDPVKGITALQRVGVSFTQQQRDMIKSLVDTGDTLGAQKIIIAELNKEFGGQAAAAAKTYAGALAQLKNEAGNLGEALGTRLLPPLVDITRIATGSIRGIAEFGDVMAEGSKRADEFANFNDKVAVRLQTLADWAAEIVNSTMPSWMRDAAGGASELGHNAGTAAPQLDDLAQSEEDAAQAADELAKAQSRANQELLNNMFSIQSEAESFAQGEEDRASRQRDLDAERIQLAQKRQSVLAEIELVKEDSDIKESKRQDKLIDLNQKLNDLTVDGLKLTEQEASLAADAARAMEDKADAAQRVVYNLLEQKAAADGLVTSDETRFLQDTAVSMGLVDRASADAAIQAAETADQFWAGFQQTGQAMTTLETTVTKSTDQISADFLKVQGPMDKTRLLMQGIAAYDGRVIHYGVEFSTTGSIPGSSDLGLSPIGGGRAAGGPVVRGRPYMVGERGPEMFVPQNSGRIVPATQLKEKQAQQTVNITINGNFRNINDLDYLAQEITKRSIPA